MISDNEQDGQTTATTTAAAGRNVHVGSLSDGGRRNILEL